MDAVCPCRALESVVGGVRRVVGAYLFPANHLSRDTVRYEHHEKCTPAVFLIAVLQANVDRPKPAGRDQEKVPGEAGGAGRTKLHCVLDQLCAARRAVILPAMKLRLSCPACLAGDLLGVPTGRLRPIPFACSTAPTEETWEYISCDGTYVPSRAPTIESGFPFGIGMSLCDAVCVCTFGHSLVGAARRALTFDRMNLREGIGG
eukprot:1194248-Prorocentrum_minimum.AAC.1